MTPFKILIGLLASAAAVSASAEAPNDTSNWKTYRNESMKFEVKYPNTWHVRQTTGTMESVLISSSSGVEKPNLSVQFAIQRNINPKGLPISEWKAEMLKIQNKKNVSFPTTDTNIGGRPAFRSERMSSFGRGFTFFTLHNQADIFQVMVTQPSSEKELNKTYEAIISTIKFIK